MGKMREKFLSDLDDIWQDVAEVKLFKTAYRKLQKTIEGTIEVIGRMVELRDPYTYIHQKEVAELACKIGERIGLENEMLECIHVAGLLHDIGKIAVPIEILSKPGKINDYEYNIIKGHSQIGHDIIEQVEFPWPIAEIILQHHERLDGSGYPQGIGGDEIRLEARILAVADVFNAMISHRPYRKAHPIGMALDFIMEHKGTLFDSFAVGKCVELYTTVNDDDKSLDSAKMRLVFGDTLDALVNFVEKRDPYTAGHQSRVAKLSCAIAEKMKLDKKRIETLRIAATVHDIGMLYIPAEILLKPGKLTMYEFNMIRNHTRVGYEILKTMDFNGPVAEIVLQHHERIDGSGYPLGLIGDKILLEARILAVADVVEAMNSHRAYRQSAGLQEALSEIDKGKEYLFDPDVVKTCIELFEENEIKFPKNVNT